MFICAYIPKASQSKPTPIQTPTLSLSSAQKSPHGRGPRTPRRVEATKLSAVDDSLGPLGPLGDNASTLQEEAPTPISKEQSLPTRNARHTPSPSESKMSSSMMDSVDLGDDTESTGARPRYPPPVQPPPSGVENARRQTQPSVSIEQAAKPSFDITVGDPHKVGDLTSSHIVYQVRTKVGFTCQVWLPHRILTFITDIFQSI